MSTIKAQFNGHVFVPEGPVDLPVGSWVEIPAISVKASESSERPLMKLLDLLDQFPDEPRSNAPEDLAEQHDHYLYGTPKRS
jgi:hypothetical protein